MTDLWEREGMDSPDITMTDRPKDTLHDYALTMTAEKLEKSEAEVERLNRQLVTATDRELMLRKDMDALNARVERLHEALHELVILKLMKDADGKTPAYLDRQPKAWLTANKSVSETPQQSLAAHDAAIWNEAADLCREHKAEYLVHADGANKACTHEGDCECCEYEQGHITAANMLTGKIIKKAKELT